MKTTAILLALAITVLSCSKTEETTPSSPSVPQPTYTIKITGTHPKPQFIIRDSFSLFKPDKNFGLDGNTTSGCYNFTSSNAVTLPFTYQTYHYTASLFFLFHAGGNSPHFECNWTASDQLIVEWYKGSTRMVADTLTYSKIKTLGAYTYLLK